MLRVNKKVYATDNRIYVTCHMNMDVRIIISNIIETIFMRYINRGIKVDFNDILFITDRCDILTSTSDLVVPTKMLGESAKHVKNRNIMIETVNALEFLNTEDSVDFLDKRKYTPSLVILGFINNIPEDVYDNIDQVFGRTRLVTFGDVKVESGELYNYYKKFLTSSEYFIDLPYYEHRNSSIKKINNTLDKFRDNKNGINKITSSSNITKTQSNELDMNIIEDSLEDGATVVVPKRLAPAINSRLHTSINPSDTLEIEPNIEYYTRFPFMAVNGKDKVFIPPLTKMKIAQYYQTSTFTNGRRYILRTCVFYLDGEEVVLKNIPIDFSSFILNFDQDEHPDNYEDYEEIENYDTVYDPFTLQLLPNKIVTEIEQKYFKSRDLTLFIETYEFETQYVSSCWYSQCCNVLESLHIVYSNYFDQF